MLSRSSCRWEWPVWRQLYFVQVRLKQWRHLIYLNCIRYVYILYYYYLSFVLFAVVAESLHTTNLRSLKPIKENEHHIMHPVFYRCHVKANRQISRYRRQKSVDLYPQTLLRWRCRCCWWYCWCCWRHRWVELGSSQHWQVPELTILLCPPTLTCFQAARVSSWSIYSIQLEQE